MRGAIVSGLGGYENRKHLWFLLDVFENIGEQNMYPRNRRLLEDDAASTYRIRGPRRCRRRVFTS